MAAVSFISSFQGLPNWPSTSVACSECGQPSWATETTSSSVSLGSPAISRSEIAASAQDEPSYANRTFITVPPSLRCDDRLGSRLQEGADPARRSQRCSGLARDDFHLGLFP